MNRILNAEQVEEELRYWGLIAGRGGKVGAQGLPSENPIYRAMINRDRLSLIKDAMTSRRGKSLKRRLLETPDESSNGHIRTVPAWATTPRRCTETRTAGERSELWPARAERVERAWLSLQRFDNLKAIVLRVEYSLYALQRVKALYVTECTGKELTVRQYRLELETARVWMAGRLAE